MTKFALSLALLSLSALVVVRADVTVCGTQAPAIFADYLTTDCGMYFAGIAEALGGVVNNPLALQGGFDSVFEGIYFGELCPVCATNVTEIIARFDAAAETDETCSLISGGFQLLCAKNSETGAYCGDFDIGAICSADASCCVPTFRAYLEAAGEIVPSLSSIAGLIDYAAICTEVTIETPALELCEWLDGTVVTEDYDWHFNFDCDTQGILDFLDGLADSDQFSSWAEEDLEHCIESILTLTDIDALLYLEADEDHGFAHVCSECQEVLNAFIEEVKSLAEDEPLCYQVAAIFEIGCQYSGDSYCGDIFLEYDPEEEISCDQTDGIEGCCFFGAFTYLTGLAEASDLESVLESFDVSEVCGASVSELTASLATCSLGNALASDAAFGFSVQSMFAIVLASIAMALMMIA